MKAEPFKTCPNCNTVWETIEEFLSDPELKMNGYQVHVNDLEGGLFFFTHNHEGCYTTLAVPVTAFLPLNDQPLLTKRDPQKCIRSEFCQHRGDLSPKPMNCECLWVRDILQTIQDWPKAAA